MGSGSRFEGFIPHFQLMSQPFLSIPHPVCCTPQSLPGSVFSPKPGILHFSRDFTLLSPLQQPGAVPLWNRRCRLEVAAVGGTAGSRGLREGSGCSAHPGVSAPAPLPQLSPAAPRAAREERSWGKAQEEEDLQRESKRGFLLSEVSKPERSPVAAARRGCSAGSRLSCRT